MRHTAGIDQYVFIMRYAATFHTTSGLGKTCPRQLSTFVPTKDLIPRMDARLVRRLANLADAVGMIPNPTLVLPMILLRAVSVSWLVLFCFPGRSAVLIHFLFAPIQSTDEYDACRANAFVPSAPLNLPKVCADPNNPASKALCLQMCQPAACCFEGKMTTGTGLCEVANLYTCSEYDGPCDNVRDMMDYGLGQRSAVTPVVQACSEKNLQTDEGIQSCRKQCSDAWCCVVDDPSLSCFESNPLFCAAYAPICGPLLSSDLLYSDINDKSKATANPIELTCSVKNILTAEGRAQCEAECSYAACCKESGRWSCQDKNEEYCEQMKACDVLERVDRAKSANVGIEVPHAAGNINDLCSKQAILSFSGRSDCDKACVPALCCFDADDSTSCRSTNIEACKSYDACSIMFQDRLGL